MLIKILEYMNQKFIKRQHFISRNLIIGGSIFMSALFFCGCSNTSKDKEYQREMFVGKWDATDALSDDMILNADGSGRKGNPALTGYHNITWNLFKDSLIIDSESAYKRIRYKIESVRDTTVAGKHIYGLFLSSTNEYGDKVEDIYRRIE